MRQWQKGQLLQSKGRHDALQNLLGHANRAAALEGGSCVRLRLISHPCHRFPVPHDRVREHVRQISGNNRDVA